MDVVNFQYRKLITPAVSTFRAAKLFDCPFTHKLMLLSPFSAFDINIVVLVSFSTGPPGDHVLAHVLAVIRFTLFS